MRAVAFRLISILLISPLLSFCAAGVARADRIVRHCLSIAEINQDDRILVTVFADSGVNFCSFTASLPPDLAGDTKAAAAAIGLWNAIASPGDIRKDVLSKEFAPSFVAWSQEQLASNSDRPGANTFSKLLEESADNLAACAADALAGKQFKLEKELVLSCQTSENLKVLEVETAFANLHLTIYMPFGSK
ncbi:hypothetical protein [Mesorhizobium sp. M7A.F.Ce.TU.012.03.2.1]|uniref:hypothetical protein n=1 Tax=Mesorhizobium sp. M7A.F.Ce.TU.012.03.2.1 TaxID=2493681 RepID=UPI000FDC6B02|nr:hypothetical protein [Mesorhizobium sp. M7A.F.Ce.TU.012.03.2.1]AZV18964.1 hypothetical protein EJ079_07540 [Mesorhizobium sp. M7A.F.Ce.TU.012.03.2.1]